MKQCFKLIAVILLAILVYAAQGHADSVLLHNGDRLIGTVQNKYFALQSPYGQIVFNNDFLKRFSLSNSQPLETPGAQSIRSVQRTRYYGLCAWQLSLEGSDKLHLRCHAG